MMGRRWLNRHDPWFPALLLSATALLASSFALGMAIYGSGDGDPLKVEPAPRQAVAPTPPLSLNGAMTFAGDLPGSLAGWDFSPVANGEQPDVRFERDSPEAVVTRYFVPIVALGTGVDALTLDQARAVIDGSLVDWAAVGGLPGKVVRAVAVTPADPVALAFLQRSFGNVPEGAVTYGTYQELRAAMTIDSGMVALVPLTEVRFTQGSIAVDGMDPVRGRGDLSAWPFAERISVTANTPRGDDALVEIRAALAERLPIPVTVVATGDILQSRCSLARIRDTGDWAAALRGPVAEYLAAANLALASLDGSIQDIGTPHFCVRTTNLTSPPEVMEALTVAGIDEVTVATNHVFDCGQTYCGNKAFLRTLELLAAANIKVVGGGSNLEAALAPAIFEVGGVRFGLLGFDDIAAEDFGATDTAPGTAPLDDSYDDERALSPRSPAFYQSAGMLGLARFTERIRLLKAQVDVVIVQVQSGTEDTHRPSARSIKALRAAADAGADVVVGNQAHWVQAVEVRGNSFIAYALGNFVYDQTDTPEHTHGYLLETTFHGKTLVAVRFVPYQIEGKYRPTFVSGETRLKILGDVFTATGVLPPP